MFVFNGFQAIEGSIPADIYFIVNGFLAVLASYFRVNTQATFE